MRRWGIQRIVGEIGGWGDREIKSLEKTTGQKETEI